MNPDILSYTSSALTTLTILGSLAATLFLIKGGYHYIISNGKPDSLEEAKKTIRNALIGLVLILSATTFSSLLSNAFNNQSATSSTQSLSFIPIEPVEPAGGLTQVLLEAIGALLQTIIQSATQPITDAIISFLTTTPVLSTNSVVFNFWLTSVGIVDALFGLLIALLGFQFMSASTFGFDELELKKILPRIGLAFLGANMSIFLIDVVINFTNVLVETILSSTGGLNQAWIANAFDPANLSLEQVAFVSLIFMILFLILSVVLLLYYITRLIGIALGAVLSPFIFLLWAFPKFSDFAEISAKTYLISILSIFIHVVVIQLAAAFLTLPDQVGSNSMTSILLGVGLLLTLLKTQSFMIQLMFYNSGRTLVKKIGGQIMNVVGSNQQQRPFRHPRDMRVTRSPRKLITL